MKIKQLCVFLENKVGRFKGVADILGKAGINMTAFSVADTSDFGILRVIVSEPEKSLQLLKEAGYAAGLTDVICIKCPNTAGSLAKVLDVLNEENVQIEYMYAFSMGNIAQVVIRPAEIQNCEKVLEKHGIELVSSDSLYSM
ncbi:MAG: amino acid-binding protein [Bacteroidales bacterium]|nr:amino acid-binding protein [Bacteroidales bacterium]